MHPLLTRFAPLAALALAGLGLASWTAMRTVTPPRIEALAFKPQQGPWPQRVAATGLIEGDGEEIRIGTPEAGLVVEVTATVGRRVAAGDLLFRLDDRLVRAELAIAASERVTAQANLVLAGNRVARLAALPRSEDIPPIAARLRVAEAHLADARIHRSRIETLWTKQGASASQVDAMRGAESIALAGVESARTDLAHVRLAAWDRDLAIAEAEAAVARTAVSASEARCDAVRIRLERLAIRAPRDATIVDLGVTVGALASPADPRLVVLADLSSLFVRVEVPESQAWKVQPGAPGRGWVRGDASRAVDLAFVRIEPRASTRRAIAGQPGERLDGRVLQILYRLVDPPAGMHPGFLLEVDIAAGATEAGHAAPQ